MNGEVMDESTKTPQHDNNDMTEQAKLPDNKQHDGEEQPVVAHEKEKNEGNSGEKSGINDGERSDINDGERSGINDGDKSSINDNEKSGINDGERSSINYVEQSGSNDDERSGINDGERCGINDVEQSSINDGEKFGINDGERSCINDVEQSGMNDVEDINDGERFGINDGVISGINNGEISSINDGERSGVSDGERSSIDDVERSGINDVERSSINDGERSSISDRERSSINDVERSGINDVERSSINDAESLGNNDGERSDIIPDVDKESVQVEESKGPCLTETEKEKSHLIPEICEEKVETKEMPLYVKNTEEVCHEDSQTSFTTSTNGLDEKESDKHMNMKGSPEPESELENSNGLPEKINNNSKDSSMLSTTDTQDEIDTIDNGDQIFLNHVHNQTEDASQNEMAKKQMLDMGTESEDSIEEMLGSDLDPQTEETFSIGSEYDEASQGSVLDKSNDIIVIENDSLPNQNGNKSPEVHEIESDNEDDDDCVVTAENRINDNKKQSTEKSELRRSSRTTKRKKYSYSYENVDEESDIEEVLSEDLLKRKSRPIMINDTKSLVEIAAKQAARSTSAQRKEPQLVLIGSSSNPTAKVTANKCIGSNLNASLYQSIVARGTTVTPVPSKQQAATISQASQTLSSPVTATPAILPSLTDDMFVVEAPSFIVPYVYEKPSIEHFREFVNKLGKELEEKLAKAEKELLEKKKEDKAKRQKERQEIRDRGEEVEDSEDEVLQNIDDIKKRKMEKQDRRRQKDEDDESWAGSDSSDSENFKITDENGSTILIKEKDEEVKDSLETAPSKSKSENYFDCSLGKFFMNIGMGLVEEYVQTDLLKQQKRKLQRAKKSGESTKEGELSICLLMKNLELSKENNIPYTCAQLKCEHCSFKTESALVLAQHLETPHMKNNMYKCNFCSFEIRSPHDILFHMKAEHNVLGKLERTPAYHQCANCPFEDNGKGKLARHLVACAKKFKPEQNLSPPFEWEPPAKIPKVSKARNSMLGSPYTGTAGSFGRAQFGSSFGRAPIVSGMMPGVAGYRPRTRFPLVPPTTGPRPVQAGGSIVRGSSMLRMNATSVANYSLANAKKTVHQPSISITPLPRQPPPMHVQPGQNSKGTFVICEICDGYIKDLDQLRNHMQWIHKVKIHPKMIYNRPPLNCQKCQFRFFTDQGLERHLLGSHGLVTSSMQEAANKSKDAGRCPVCGKVYQWKLLNHVARDHNLTLKPAHLSYKCTVCTATFGMYKLFENHVYSAHSIVAKRVMDKNVPPKTKSDAPKGLKLNDEITITAQPAKPALNKDK